MLTLSFDLKVKLDPSKVLSFRDQEKSPNPSCINLQTFEISLVSGTRVCLKGVDKEKGPPVNYDLRPSPLAKLLFQPSVSHFEPRVFNGLVSFGHKQNHMLYCFDEWSSQKGEPALLKTIFYTIPSTLFGKKNRLVFIKLVGSYL